ncbi:MAG: NAD(P)-dependent alcohol dehydrogenase [Candidatus Brocadiaceae bacterium]|jgi:L-iditol 2-dehydrogenase
MGAKTTMKAVYLVARGEFDLREVPVPEPGPGEVLVAVRSCGICGSDIHFYEKGRIGDFVVAEPLVLGHEAAGEVVGLGADVRALERGDRVAVEPGIPCRRCEYCLSGRYNLCPDVMFLSAPPHDGFFREYVSVPEEFAYRLPESVSMEAGATVEPLAVGLHAVGLVGLGPGERVAVLGTGPIGLLAIAAARAAGATEVAAVDLVPMRLEFALRMGATVAVNAGEEDASVALADWADVVLDCVAVSQTLTQAFDIIRPGGRVAWVGMAGSVAEVPFQKFQLKEASVTGVFRYANRFGSAVNLLASGMIDPLPLVTHRFEFPRVEDAVEFAAQNRQLALKTMVNFG